MREPTLQIPNEAGWNLGRLDEMCSVLSRGRAPTYVERSRVLAIGQRCVTAGGFDPGATRPHAERAMRGVLQPEFGDVLLNSTGTGTIGRSCVFDAPGVFVVDGHVTVLRLRSELGVGGWLSGVLRTPWGQSHLETQCYSGSTNQVELSRTRLGSTRLPTPPLPEQRRIAEVLDTIDEAIRKTEEIIAKLEQVKQGLLHDLLTRGIDDDGELRDPDRHPEQFKDSPLGRMPRGWQCGPAAAWCDRLTVGVVNSATHAYVDEGVPFIRSQNVKANRIVLDDVLFVTEAFNAQQSKSILRAGDVAIVRTGYPGTAAVVPDHLDGSNCFSLVIASPRATELRPHFLAQFLNSPVCKAAIRRMQFGSAQHNFNVGEMRRLEIALPAIEEQEAIISAVGVHETRTHQEELGLAKLRLLKNATMEDLLTGRVRVTALLEESPE